MSALRHARPTPSRPFATPDAAHPHPATGEGWAATLELAFERRAHASVLVHVRHRGPLTVQRPLYPEGPETCHAIVVHPPGGVAGGDTLDLDIELREHAHAVLTMPGAAKFYPAHGRSRRTSRWRTRHGRAGAPDSTSRSNGAANAARCRTCVTSDH